MTDRTTDLHRSKRGVAILAACIVQTIRESDPSFEERFLKRLTEAYYKLRDDSQGDVVQEMELLSWTREYLTGFNPISGQGKPLLDDFRP